MNTVKAKISSLVDILVSQNTFLFYIIAGMIGVPLSEFISEMFFKVQLTAEHMTFSVFAIIGLFLCSMKIALRPTGKHWSDIFFFTLHIFMFISLIYSCDILRAFRESQTTEFPIYFVGYYCMLFAGFQLEDIKKRKLVLYTMCILSFLEGIIAILQTFQIKIMPVPYKSTVAQAYGLTQNINFWGGLSVLFVGVTAGVFIFTKKKYIRIIAGVLTAVAAYTSFNSMARLAWVGVFTITVFFPVSILIMMRKKKDDAEYRKFLKTSLKAWVVWLIISVASISLSFLNPELTFFTRVESTANQLQGDVKSWGSDRVYLWYFCWEGFKNHWVTGVGLDNIKWCYTENIHWFQDMYYSNYAHNIYLHTLATQGIFAFINYMALLIISGVKGVKRVLVNDNDNDRIITWICVAMFAGHLVASFFNCRLFYVEFYFYIILGIMNARTHEKSIPAIDRK